MIYISIDSIFCVEFKKIYFKVIWGHIKVIKRSNLEYLPKYLHYTYISTPNSMRKSNSRSNWIDSGVKRSFEVTKGSFKGQIKMKSWKSTIMYEIYPCFEPKSDKEVEFELIQSKNLHPKIILGHIRAIKRSNREYSS